MKQKNPAISLSRIVGMILIILCHIVKYYTMILGHQILPELLNCGVHLFLFISGYLYGGKIITNFKQWFVTRIQYVTIPTVLISLLTIIALFIAGNVITLPSIVAYLLDTEGLLFLNYAFFDKFIDEILSLGPLWFTTIIMLCYCLVPLLQRITCKTNKIKSLSVLLLVSGILLSAVLNKYINIIYFTIFSLGYLLGNIKVLDRICFKKFVLYSILLIITLFGQLVLRRFYDNSPIYLWYAPWSKCVMGIWFVVFFAFIDHWKHETLVNIASSKVITSLDKYSFYVYLVHGIFCMGFFNVYEHMSLPFATLVFLVCTIIFAFILKFISDWCNKIFFKISK